VKASLLTIQSEINVEKWELRGNVFKVTPSQVFNLIL